MSRPKTKHSSGARTKATRSNQRRGLSSLRWRLAAVLAAGLSPIAALGIFQGTAALMQTTDWQRDAFANRAAEISAEENRKLEQALAALGTFSKQAGIRAEASDVCIDALGSARQQLPMVVDLASVRADGTVRCSLGRRVERPRLAAVIERLPRDRPELVAAGNGESTTLIIGASLADDSADRTGAAGALIGTLSQQRLGQLARQINPDGPGHARLLDGEGRPLSLSPIAQKSPQKPIEPAILRRVGERLQGKQSVSVFDAPMADGSKRLYALASLLGGDLHLLLGRPMPDFFAFGRAGLWLQMILPAIMWAMAVVISWVAADRLVLRWVRAERRLVSRFRAGELDARLDARGAPGEFRDLNDLLGHMARAQRDREAALEDALAEKTLLLREVHHRVKNNLQIITSLLNLQGRTARDDGERRILNDAQTRINALAAVHHVLYAAENLERVELRAFLSRLGNQIANMAGQSGAAPAITVDAPSIEAPPDKAIPLALIASEATANAIKHSLGDSPDGEVRIRISPSTKSDSARCYDVVITDNGGGIDRSGTEPAGTAAGIGTTLMRAFARQLGGRLEIDRGEGGYRLSIRDCDLAH